VEVREEGAAAPVPISLESPATAGWFLMPWTVTYTAQRLIKLSRNLREGAATLSFLDDCGGTTNQPLVPPVRDEHFRFKVGPAVPFPTSVGAARVTSVEFVERSHCQRRRYWVEIDLTPDLAAFPLLGMSARAGGGGFAQGFWRPRKDLIQGNLFAACGPGSPDPSLTPGRHTVEFIAEIAGGPTLPPLLMTLDVDCSADAGVCEDSLAPDAAVPEPDAAAAAPDIVVAMPDTYEPLRDAAPPPRDQAPPPPDAAPPPPDTATLAPAGSDGSAASRTPGAAASGADASGVTATTPADHACDCATGGAPRGAPVLGLGLVLGWCARRFTGRRQRARASDARPRPRRP
jgi:hypothetical protein